MQGESTRQEVAARPYTTGQIARMSSVHINVVKKWIVDGLLKAYRLPAGHYRITPDAYLEFLTRNDLPLPNELARTARRPRYLVIDDDQAQRNLLADFLSRKTGVEVKSAGDGYEGLIKVGSFRPDVVFLDIAMPRMDGFSMLEAMAKTPPSPAPKVVVVTGNKTPEVLARMAKFDLAGRIFKPYTLQQVDEILDQVG